MASKYKWVAFRTNSKIPAAVLGEKEDVKVNAGEPVRVPADYADHVVHDRFAEFSVAPPKPVTKKQATETTVEKAARELADVQRAVSDADLHLISVTGTVDEEAAREALVAAQAALDALPPAT